MARKRPTKKRPSNRTGVDIKTSTRDLLKRIIAMPGNGRSATAMMDILVRDEAARVGLIEEPKCESSVCPNLGCDDHR